MRGKFRRYDLPEPLSPYVRRTSGIEKDTKQRGGELITIRPNVLRTAEQIPLESLRPLRSRP